MPTAWRLLEDEMEAYLQELLEGNRTEITIKEYRWALTRIFKALSDGGLEVNPRKVGRTEINFIRNDYLAGKSERYKADMVSMMMGFAKWAGNQELAKIKIGFGSIQTKRVRWLKNEQSVTLKLSAHGIETMIVHCELDLGMRRGEMLKLKVGDFSTGRINAINLLGKGRYGGKPRTINWHPDTMGALEEYLEMRDKIISKA